MTNTRRRKHIDEVFGGDKRFAANHELQLLFQSWTWLSSRQNKAWIESSKIARVTRSNTLIEAEKVEID